MQVNTTLTTLNLFGNKLDPEGGKAIAKSLEVTPIFIVRALSHDIEFIFCFFLFFFLQVNTSLTNLDLGWNRLGPEGGKAFAKMLEVTLSTSMSTPNVIFFVCCNFFCAQVNKSLTDLNLRFNDLGLEGYKALAKSLEVSPIFIVTLSTTNLIFLFFTVFYGRRT
jgi:hypothetical protein